MLTNTSSDVAAANEVALRNLGLMHKLVNQWRAYAESIGVDHAQLRSLAAEALVRASRTHDPSRGTLSHFVFVCMRSLMDGSADYHKRRPVLHQMHGDHHFSVVVDSSVHQREAIRLVNHAVETLPVKAKEVIQRRFFEGQTYHEVASAIGVTRDTVRHRERKALRYLKPLLKVLCILAVMCVQPIASRADIWREDNWQLIPGTQGIWPAPGIDLSNRDLSFASIQSQDLTGASFAGSNLNSADFTGSTLTSVNFTGADLTNAVLWSGDVTGASFTAATVVGASFYDLNGFTASQLYSTASYQGGDLSSMTFGEDGGPPYADMQGWNFSGENLEGTIFWNVDLTGANFSGADITGASFIGDVGADLSGALISDETVPAAVGLPEPSSHILLGLGIFAAWAFRPMKRSTSQHHK